jgi:hypothetical protein
MTIKKQEFYEGAALHLLARSGGIAGIKYNAPFFVLNDRILVYLKYSTQGRSPWGFTFMPAEQALLRLKASEMELVIALICGDDGVAAITYDSFGRVASPSNASVHIACYRRHGEHYDVKGPDGRLDKKVAPSTWQKILEN